MDKSIEELIISNFILEHRRQRARFELFNKRKRDDSLWRMRNKEIFGPKSIERLEKPVSSPQMVYDLLKQRGAPDSCYVMHLLGPYDGQILTLEQGVEDLVFSGFGLISCIHGKLAYVEGEGPAGCGRHEERFLLLKK